MPSHAAPNTVNYTAIKINNILPGGVACGPESVLEVVPPEGALDAGVSE